MDTTLAKSTQHACNLLLNSGLTEDGSLGAMSNAAIANLIAKLKDIFEKKHYVWSTNNLIGIRTSDVYTDEFTDIGIIVEGDSLMAYPISTKPGMKYLDHPENANGCACLKEGQYLNMWQFHDEFNGWTGDPYMMQVSPCNVYREVNHGTSINRNAHVDTGLFGVNYHSWKGFNSEHVANLSAGCQTMNESVLVGEVLPHLEKSFKGTPTTYTLIHTDDFKA